MDKITVRPYINEWDTEVSQAIKDGFRRILVNAPTGSGKTIFAAVEFLKYLKAKRCLFVTHRRKLSTQTVDKFQRLGITNISYIMDKMEYIKNSNIHVGTIQSLANKTEKDIGEFDFIIIDEVHLGHDKGQRNKFLARYSDAVIIGLSATPIDERGYLLENFDYYCNTTNTADMIKQDWLVQPIYEAPYTPDLSSVRIGANNEYIVEDVADVMNLNEVNKTVLDNWKEKASDRKTMIFCVNIDHATSVFRYFKDNGVDVSMVHSKMPEISIETSYKHFAGDGQVLVNVDMATVGFDETSVNCIAMLRPVHSLRLYLQMGGRGLRTHDGKKDCLMLDFGGNIERHGFLEQERVYEFKQVFGTIIDRELSISEDVEQRQSVIESMPKDRQMFLRRVGNLLDLYSQKEYLLEADLMKDIRNFLKVSGYFSWRQNSGVTNMGGYGKENPPRWIHFTDIKGLPDITLFAKKSSMYIGLEAKTKKGVFTKHQKTTLPRLNNQGILFFIIDDIVELWKVLKHIKKNVVITDNGVLVKNSIWNLWDKQTKYRTKLGIK